MKIDSHQHFWQYNPEDYGWMGEEMDRVRRDFLPITWSGKSLQWVSTV